VEADFGAIPLLLLTADRPARLKGRGANQTVNQECFLRRSVRLQAGGAGAGLHAMGPAALQQLAQAGVLACRGQPGLAPGPVHLNLPLEEPLHGDEAVLLALQARAARPASPLLPDSPPAAGAAAPDPTALELLDPGQPGLIVAGPWRGLPQQRAGFLQALRQLQQRTGWPLLADALSGLRGEADLAPVAGYDLLLAADPRLLQAAQILRLGPVPASRRLQAFLQHCGGRQLLITEGEPRCLDPLGCASAQLDRGLAHWWQAVARRWGVAAPEQPARALARRWCAADQRLQACLDSQLRNLSGDAGEASGAGRFSEPALARALNRLLPAGLPLVLANSSPVRDWESFTPPDGPLRPLFSFRGASGIDGTLSLACGVAEALGGAALITGDLALLHDANGWLWRRQLSARLTVLLLDNGGGGIFEQLAIRAACEQLLDFDRLFAMPQAVDPLALAAAHGVPGRQPGDDQALETDLAWALAQPFALLRLRCDRRADAAQRRALRTMGAACIPRP